MNNYNDPKVQKIILGRFKELWPNTFPIDIVVGTYNRFLYLQKCVWSILAATQVPYRLIVGDDNSPAYIKEWLIEMRKRKKIHGLILNKINVGGANNFNKLIDSVRTPWFAVFGDDIWVHRGCEFAAMDIALQFADCGIVSFYDFSNIKLSKGYTKINNYVIKGGCTGLGCSLMLKELWLKAGKYYLPEGKKMGFFSSKFCEKAFKLKNIQRKHLYITIPHYGRNMDRVSCKLEEVQETVDSGYIWHRITNKRGVSIEKAKEMYYKKDKKVVLE